MSPRPGVPASPRPSSPTPDPRPPTPGLGPLLAWCSAGRSQGGDAWLRQTILRLDKKINSLRSPDNWWADVQRSLAADRARSLAKSAWSGPVRRLFELEFETVSSRLDLALAKSSGKDVGKLAAYVAPIETLRDHVGELRRRLASEGFWSALADKLATYPIARLVSVPDAVPGKKAVKGLIDGVKESLASLADLTQRNEADLLADLAGLAPHAAALADLCRQYRDAYAAAKRERGMLDFNDLERCALRLLAEFPEVREATASQFREVLVDEYQDISPVQDAILRAVAGRDPDDRQPHDKPAVPLFMVGDLKQSIYRFRLAEPDIFSEMLVAFAEASPRSRGGHGDGATVIHLADNFRSRRVIIDAANAVFAQLMPPVQTLVGGSLPAYDESAKLRFAAPPYVEPGVPPDAPVELHLLDWSPPSSQSATTADGGMGILPMSNALGLHVPDTGKMPVPPTATRDAESGEDSAEQAEAGPGDSAPPDEASQVERLSQQARLVGRRIRQLLGFDGSPPATVWDDSAKQFRPARPRDVVILLRTAARVAQTLAEELTALGLPVHATQPGGYFQAVEIADVRALLAILDNPRQDIPLAAVLRSPLMAMIDSEPLTVDELAAIRAALRESQPEGQFYDAVVAAGGRNAECGIRNAESQGTLPLGDSSSIPNSLRDQLSRFLARISAWRTMARRQPLSELLADIFRVTGYLDYVAGLIGGQQRQANLLHLAGRARQFDHFARQGLARFARFLDELERAGEDLGVPSALSEADDVVRIMTVHAAKGLEFPVVVLADLEHQFNLADLGDDLLFHRQLLMGLRCLDSRRRIRFASLPHHLISTQLSLEMLLEEVRLQYVAMTRPRDRLLLFGSRKGLLKQLQGAWRQQIDARSLLEVRCPLDWLAPAILASPGAAAKSLLDEAAAIESLPDQPMHAAGPLFSVDVYGARWLTGQLSASGPDRADRRTPWQEAAIRGEALPPPASGGSEEISNFKFRISNIKLEEARLAATRSPEGAQGSASREEVSSDVKLNDALVHAAVAEQLGYRYPLESLTGEPAKRSVSELKHLFETRAEADEAPPGVESGFPSTGHWPLATGHSSPGTRHSAPDTTSLPPWELPAGGDARARGLATHAVLQRLDLSAAKAGNSAGSLADPASVARQIKLLADARLLEPHRPELVDAEAIAAFFAGEIGQRMLARPDRVRREWPFSLAVPANELNPSLPAGPASGPADAADRVLVQGIIDVLLDEDDGSLTVLDFKTDAVRGQAQAQARAADYAIQLHWYARAAATILARPVARMLVYFLAARQLVEVSPA